MEINFSLISDADFELLAKLQFPLVKYICIQIYMATVGTKRLENESHLRTSLRKLLKLIVPFEKLRAE